MTRTMASRLLALTVTGLCATACNTTVKPVEYGDGGCDVLGEGEQFRLSCATGIDLVGRNVDILFVIDNSGSMAEEQAKLANSLGALVDALDAPQNRANYRIAFTTTDDGNPWCGDETSPEGGEFVASSCQDRPDEFTSVDGMVDAFQSACDDVCALGAGEFSILPTRTVDEDEPAPRPWIEKIDNATNLDGVDVLTGLQCVAPQGIRGCGFESPLESMYKAMARMESAGEPSAGFLRADSQLAVIFLSDEADCSYRDRFDTIFHEDGSKVFWSDPDAAFPTSAVCWNAGVQCSGLAPDYSDCRSSNKDVNGNIEVDDEDAVLHPVSRYTELLRGVWGEQQLLNGNRDLVVAALLGVGDDGLPMYSAGDDGAVQEFGIDPGCVHADDGMAVPPVRMRDVVTEFSSDGMFSVCEDDYADAMSSIADLVTEEMYPGCYTECVLDKGDAPGLQPSCTIEERRPGEADAVAVPECRRDSDGYVVVDGAYQMPSDDVNVCHAARSDADGLTSDTFDDISERCLDEAYNLEFFIERRPGFPVPLAQITASCQLSSNPQDDCPGI